jgi:DNA helicase-4
MTFHPEYLFVIIIAFLLSTILYDFKKRRKIKVVKQNLSKIEEAVAHIRELTNGESFLRFSKLTSFHEKYSPLRDTITFKPQKIKLPAELRSVFNTFIKWYDDGTSQKDSYNDEFIKKELIERSNFFKSLNQYPLTDKQCRSIVINEDNNLIVAGAGTGKTTTLVSKAIYLINCLNVPKEKILLLAFTKKAANEMKKRIEKHIKNEIDVLTFHALGRSVISKAENSPPSLAFNDSNPTVVKRFLNSILEELVTEPKYLKVLNKFFLHYLRPYKSIEKFNNRGEYLNYLKSLGNLTLKKSSKGEIMKSMEEVQIANYLFVNGINYEYEKQYEHNTSSSKFKQYQPDFYLVDSGIYLEHFALIDKAGNVPHWFDSKDGNSPRQSYNDGIKWKRSIHKKHNTTLIETYSYEMRQGNLFANLEKKLKNKGVIFNKQSEIEIYRRIKEINEIPLLINLIMTFINLMKSNGYKIKDIQEKIDSNERLFSFFRDSNSILQKVSRIFNKK